MPKNAATYLNLETISKDGAVPESRLNDPIAVQAIVRQMITANEKRSKTDAKVYGLVSGNPPFSPAKLREEGQAWRANFPSRIGEAFLNVALTSYWDLINEAPTKCEVRTAYGNDDERDEWSGIITEEFERLNQDDADLNYMFRHSQHDMVLYRYGPVIFDDFYNFKARPINQSYLLADDGSSSNINEWIIAGARVRYKADELYAFIRNPEAARSVGFDVKEVRRALVERVDSGFWGLNTRNRDWLFYEQRIRNNDLYVSRISEEIPVAHVWYREFPKEGESCGRISHCMIIEDGEPASFLFRRVGRFEKWQNVIHAFHYDTGDGTHHSVKGLGIKSFAALSHYDRLQCHLADMAYFSGIHFQARDAASMQNLAVQAMGPYIVHPPGTDLLNVEIGGNLQAPLAVKQDFLTTLTSNLSQYRQDVQRRRTGAEPPTARQINYESENENVIGKSGMTWYCEQLDPFWAERFRRAANPNLTEQNPNGREALAFQKRCRDRGVPPEALQKIEHVRATRTIGMGSADARMQAMVRMLSRFPLYDENGKRKILENITAMDVGWSQMRQYIRKQADTPYTADQRSEASQWVGSMKVGVAPEGSPSWNPVIFAGVWLKAASDAVNGLQQGANPMEVAGFLEIIGPAIRQQLDRIGGSDERRKGIYDEMDALWRKLSGIHDQLVAQIQKQQQAQMRQQQKIAQQTQQSNGELAIKAAEARGKLQISKEKKDENMQLKREVHDQRLLLDAQKATQDRAIADVETATQIRNESLKSKSKSR